MLKSKNSCTKIWILNLIFVYYYIFQFKTFSIMKNNNNSIITATAIIAQTLIAVVAMTLVSICASGQTTMSGKPFEGKGDQPHVGSLFMGAGYVADIVTFNMEASWLTKDTNKGGYFGLEFGGNNRGANDVGTIYGGKAFRLGQEGSFRLGATLGSASSGNTVTDLTRWGMGYVAGTDGADSFVGSIDAGFVIPVKEYGACTMTYGQSTVGPIVRLAYGVRF